MKTYQQLKLRQSKEFDEFDGIFFAFNNEQFNKGLEKFGLAGNLKDKLVSIGSGGYVLSSKLDEFQSLIDKHNKEIKDLKKNKKLLLEALVYELKNHEYSYTWNIEPALNALELTIDDVPSDILKKAKKIAGK